MKIKTLAIAAATLAVGAITSQAQVYSQNIVGYINYLSPTNAPGFDLVCNPLDNGTNSIKSLFASAPGGSLIQVWNTASQSFLAFTYTAGHWKTNNVSADSFVIPPGTGFFIQVAGSTQLTNTFAGTIAVPTGVTVTNNIANAFTLVGSKIPYSDTVSNAATVNITGVPGGMGLQAWNVASQSFQAYTYSGGKWKLNGVANVPVINVGQGFFLYQASGSYNWVQTGP
jgi:hypothetical protein